MQTRPFGPTGRDLPLIGQGTWKLRDFDGAVAALRLGLDLGLSHIDTAEVYKGAELAIREAIADRRDEVFLVSKVMPRNATRRGTRLACEASLARLNTDYLDAYLLHWPGPVPLAETMAAMARLVDDGLIRAVGVSNFDVSLLEKAQDALGGVPLACNQVLYHPEARDIEVDLIPYCRQRGIAVVGYSPFGSGMFPGGAEGYAVFNEIGERHGLTAHQAVLNFLARDGVFQIPKAERTGHVRENAAALEAPLDAAALSTINDAFPVPRSPRGIPTL